MNEARKEEGESLLTDLPDVPKLKPGELFEKEKMEGEKKTSYVYILYSNFKVNVVF